MKNCREYIQELKKQKPKIIIRCNDNEPILFGFSEEALKVHDKELVEQIVEKIKTYFNKNLLSCEEYLCCGFSGKTSQEVYEFLDSLLKEGK